MKKYCKILSLILTVILVYFLLKQINYADISGVLKKVSWEFLLAAFGTYLMVGWVRTLRFHELLQKQVNFRKLFAIGFVHSFLVSLLPARSGELSYVYFINKSSINLGSNITSLFVARIFDIFAIAILALLALSLLGKSIVGIGSLALVMAIAIAIGFLFLLLVLSVFWETKVLWIIDLLFSFFKFRKYLIGQNIFLVIRDSLISLRQLRNSRLLLSIIGLTTANWLLVAFSNQLLAIGFGLN
ncbi:MAG: lysylphosphatidylglycerol synthase transmembrane domain-containing protein, partial [Patescibacteria group bacterium]